MRGKTGAPGGMKARGVTISNKRMGNEYLAERAKEAAERPKTHAATRYPQGSTTRGRSGLTRETVAHIRWLVDVAGVSIVATSRLMGLDYDRTWRVVQCLTWGEVFPAEAPDMPHPADKA